MAYQSNLKIIATESGEQILASPEQSAEKAAEKSEVLSKALREVLGSETEG